MDPNTLEKIFYNPKTGLLSAGKFYKKLKDLGYTPTLKQVNDFINKQEPSQVMKQRTVKHDFPLSSHSAFERLQADLLDLSPWSKWNGNYKYLLVCIDVYTKYLFVRPLKSKTETDISAAFKEIFDDIIKLAGYYPTKLESDQEASIKSLSFRAYCEKLGITQIFVTGDDQAVVVEHMNRNI